MARYREKALPDLRWNSIRRRLTRELDTQIADWREEALNQILTKAWEQYSTALAKGKVLELEPEYADFVSKALDDAKLAELVKVDEAA